MKTVKIKLYSEDKIPGGRADNRSINDFDSKQIEIGRKVELEHTDDDKLAVEIAMDHLSEIPDYYTRLLKLEKFYESEQDFSDIEKKIVAFFRTYSKPINDKIIHKLSDKLGINTHEFESIIYKLLQQLI